MAGTDVNITRLKLAEESIRRSLDEKETLLKEVHHRVKNNLQIVSSLLRMQARRFEHERDRQRVLESENRIRSMALVHEMLYASSGLSEIDFADYVSRLAHRLRTAFGEHATGVDLVIDASDSVLDLDTAVHLGLILNELISNALKHAFPSGRSGSITVRLDEDEHGLHVTVQDDGVGLPEGFELENIQTLGVQLVRAVSTQIGADMEFRTNGGTFVRISVPAQGGKCRDQAS